MEQGARNFTNKGALLPNDQIIIAGYGLQANFDGFIRESSLKFARFNTFGFSDAFIHYTSKYAQECGGRS